MPIVNPSQEQFDSFASEAVDDGPIVMVNLLKFRAEADYGAQGPRGVSGRDAYKKYSKGVMPLLWEVGGQVLWMGDVRAGVIVPEGESWDEVVLVHYPSRGAFARMVRSEAYQAVMPHRTAALADSRLIETKAVRLPRWILRAARGAVRLKSLVWAQIPR